MGCSLKGDLASAANQYALTGRPRPTRLAPSQAIIRNFASNVAIATGTNQTVALAVAEVGATVKPIEAEVSSGLTPLSAIASLTSASRRLWLTKESQCRGTS